MDQLRHQPKNLPGKDIGLIIGHNLHKYLHQIHQNWPFKSRNCTHFGDNHGRDTDSRQLGLQRQAVWWADSAAASL